jgi:putative sterol carrier protein
MLAEELDLKSRQLAPHFKPGFLQRHHTVFQFTFEEGESFYLAVEPAEFAFTPGMTSEPTISLMMDNHETCWGLIEGRLDGMQAFMDGRYRADGNIVLSQLLLYLFKSNDPTNIYEVQD